MWEKWKFSIWVHRRESSAGMHVYRNTRGTFMELKFEISGLESIDKDFEDLTGRVNKAMAAAMPGLRDEMVERLKQKIIDQVYKKWTPKEYERRLDHPNLGPSLIDESVIKAVPQGDDGMELTYEPRGEQYQWENPRDGDALIERIETGRGYEWDKHPGKRPFWNDFVNDLIEGGIAEKTIVDGMNAADRTLEIKATGMGS